MKGRVIVIGASHGGVETLSRLIELLPADFPAPVFVTQHLGAGSLGTLAQALGRGSRLPVAHPEDTEIFQRGRIYVAPPDRHMLVQRGHIRLSNGPRENYFRPAIDPLFRSAAVAYGPAVVGVVLTGDLDDGTAGLMAVKDRGGIAMVQDPSEAIAPSMPRSAAARVCIDHCCKVAEMGDILVNLANDDWAPPESDAHDELAQFETRISEGTFDVSDWLQFEKLSVPSGLTCPDCQSALFTLSDERMLRFRCRAGHAFSARCLLEAQARSREDKLAALFRCLMEEAVLARRLLEPPEAQSAEIRAALNRKIAKAEQEARLAWERLCAPSGFAPPTVTGTCASPPLESHRG
ncbi:chemotaxis protein CheB [Trinickia dinghuensis]|uniref:protein-glutamate methylesterase n=1 Tax=Trinickia dinghuensis TaxID=2291023 RepID=A0A3D8K2V4_9BURK|nr:chemotaxis protein CheB [Trinickia dinghuensis]RDU99382.1 chemotaxis protein CheB [Trinickia dinghuensis]